MYAIEPLSKEYPVETSSALPDKTIKELAEDQIWIYENWEDLCKTYPNQVIGVDNKTVVATDQSFGHLSVALRTKGFKPAQVARQHMDPNPTLIKLVTSQRDKKIRSLRNSDVAPF